MCSREEQFGPLERSPLVRIRCNETLHGRNAQNVTVYALCTICIASPGSEGLVCPVLRCHCAKSALRKPVWGVRVVCNKSSWSKLCIESPQAFCAERHTSRPRWLAPAGPGCGFPRAIRFCRASSALSCAFRTVLFPGRDFWFAARWFGQARQMHSYSLFALFTC